MIYIIKHDFNQSTPYYVRINNDKTFDEVYDLNVATKFTVKSQAQDWIDTYSRMSEYSVIAEYNKEVTLYNKWIKNGMIRRTLDCIDQRMSRPYNGESIDEVIDWHIFNMQNEYLIKYEHWKTWPALYTITKHLFSIKRYYSKDDEYSITFQIYTPQDGKYEDFQADINRVIDKVTYKDKDGYLIFPVFDFYLSEGGNSVSLMFHPETNKAKIEGRWSCDNEYDSLEDAFNYLRKKRYYE